MTSPPDRRRPRSIRAPGPRRGRDQAAAGPCGPRAPRRHEELPERQDALRDVDLVIPEGDFVFLVGPSGAGKSTLIKLLIRDEIATPGDGHPRRPGPRPAAAAPGAARCGARSGSSSRTSSCCRPRRSGRTSRSRSRSPARRAAQIRPAVDRVLALVGLTAQAEQVPDPALGRRAAAHGDRPRARPRPAADHRRRADRQPRPADQLGDPPAPAADQRARRDGADGDPQRRGRDGPAQARRRARGGPDHPRRGRRRVPPRGLTERDLVRRLQPPARLAGLLAQRR